MYNKMCLINFDIPCYILQSEYAGIEKCMNSCILKDGHYVWLNIMKFANITFRLHFMAF